MTRRTIPFEGKTLEMWCAPAAGHQEPEAYVLNFIGNASRAEFEAAVISGEWSDHPAEVWAVNYPGYGGSDGAATLKAIPRAALAAYDELAAHAKGKPIILSGTSLGTAAALHVSANRQVAGVFLKNPPPLRHLILGQYGWWNLWLAAGPVALQIPSDLDSLANAKRVKSPGVFILAGADEVVPPKYASMVFTAFAGEKRSVLLAGAGHNDAPEGKDDVALHQAIDWLWSTIRKH